VTLGANLVITGTNISFGGTVDGASSLTVNGSGTTTFSGAVGSTTALSSVTTDAAGSTAIDGGVVTTSGAQSYGDDVSLGTNTTINVGTVTFNGTVTGGANSLTINGNAIFGNAVTDTVTGLSSLSISGTTTINTSNITSTGTQDYTGAITLGSDTTLSTTNSNVTINNSVDGAQSLTISTGTGDVNIAGIIGGTTALTTLNINSNDVNLTGIGNGASGVTGNVSVISVDGADNGRITLSGTDYWAGGSQTYTGGSDAVVINLTGDGIFQAGGDFTFNDVYLDFAGFTITLNSNITCHQFVFYNGTLNVNGNTIETSAGGGGDFVVFGANYDENDADRGPAVNEFAYPGAGALVYNPGGPYSASFTDNATFDLTGATITVGSGGTGAGNFYVNGTDLRGNADGAAGGWNLTVRDNSSSDPVNNPPWGWPYAVVFNSTVDYGTVSGGYVSAAVPVGASGETNNNVTDNGNNTGNWDFTRPEIVSVETVYDNVVRVTFSEPIENSNNEISAAVASISLNGGGIAFTDSWTNRACTSSTNGAGDLSVIYLRVVGTTWNTDATGSSIGDASNNSTDRSGVHQNIIPDIDMLKGTLFDANGKNMIRNYGQNGFPRFTATTDECRPVLYKVEAGQAAHETDPISSPANYYNYDGRNYFHLYYSEPVNIGTEAAFQIGAGAPAYNVRSETSFGAGEHGGDIEGAGTVTVNGFFTYPGTVNRDSTDGTATASALYRDPAVTDPVFTDSDFELVIYLQGYSTGASPNLDWPGYIWGVTDPNGQTVTVLANSNITDANGNVLEPTSDPYDPTNNLAKPAVTIANVGAGWDVDPPTIATYISGTPNYYEIVSRDTTGSGLIDRLEFHILDDSSSDPAWDPATDHPDLPGNSNGIRDATLDNPSAFKIEEVGITPLTNTYNISFVSDVNNSLFTSVNVKDDPYFTLTLADSGYSWGLLSELYLTYDSNTGHITDLAGNLLASISTPIRCIERVPPKISYSLAVVDEKKVYAKFSEPVYGDDGTAGPPRATISASDFTFIGDNSIASIELLDKASDNGVSEVIFTLAKALTPDTEATGMIEPKVASVFDKPGNEMPVSNRHRVTDIGLGVVEPVWASDGIHSDALHGGASGALRDFDGTGRLMDRDITLEISILADTQRNASTKLYYDVSPDTSYIADGIWLPSLIQGFIPKANTEARGVTPFRAQGAVRDFLIPGSDEEIVDGANLEFILKVGNLFCARATEQTDSSSNIPWLIQPWIIPIRDIVRQKAGVTILNNVIDPTKGDKTIINYTITKTGLVTVQVFDLSGDIVQVLHRGRQVKGEYSFAWDGRNRGGRVVARGVYFIRVVGPGIDEMRKVLVVK